MALFGWICLLLITLYMICVALGGLYLSLGFSGKTEFGNWVFIAIAILLIWLTIHVAPFQLITKP